MNPEKPSKSQAVTRTVAICSEILEPVSQRIPTKPIADRAFGLQNGCRRGVSRGVASALEGQGQGRPPFPSSSATKFTGAQGKLVREKPSLLSRPWHPREGMQRPHCCLLYTSPSPRDG